MFFFRIISIHTDKRKQASSQVGKVFLFSLLNPFSYGNVYHFKPIHGVQIHWLDICVQSMNIEASVLGKWMMYKTCFPLWHPPNNKSANKLLNILRPRQNGRHFADDVFKCIFLNENVWILLKISLKFVPKGPIKNIPAVVQIIIWRRPGDKPLSEPIMVSLLTHICVARPQWVKVGEDQNQLY